MGLSTPPKPASAGPITDQPDPTGNGARARNWVFATLAVLVALKLVLLAGTGLYEDEAYYWFWAIHPAWSYFDHAPAVAWLIAASRALFGDSEFSVRFFALIATLGTLAALYRMANLLFASRTIGAYAMIWFCLTPAAIIFMSIMTPDPPSALFWSLTLWALAELIVSRNPNYWLLVGLMAGCGLLSKYTNFMLGAGILLWVLSTPAERLWIRTWQFWAGGGLALALFTPVVLANIATGWDALAFQAVRVTTSEVTPGPLLNELNYLAALVIFLLPGSFILTTSAAIIWLRKSAGADGRGLGLIFLTSAPLLAYFIIHALHSEVHANWLLPIIAPLGLAAASTMTAAARMPGRGALFLKWVGWTNLPLGTIALAYILIQTFTQALPAPDLDRTEDLIGWRSATLQIIDTAQTSGADFLATDDDYGLTGELAFYVAATGNTIAVRPLGAPQRYRFLAPSEMTLAGGTGLLVREIPRYGPLPDAPLTRFARAEFVTVIERKANSETLARFALYLVSN